MLVLSRLVVVCYSITKISSAMMPLMYVYPVILFRFLVPLQDVTVKIGEPQRFSTQGVIEAQNTYLHLYS